MLLAILTVYNTELVISIHVQDEENTNQFKQVAHVPYTDLQYNYCKEWLADHGYTFIGTLDHVSNISQWIYGKIKMA